MTMGRPPTRKRLKAVPYGIRRADLNTCTQAARSDIIDLMLKNKLTIADLADLMGDHINSTKLSYMLHNKATMTLKSICEFATAMELRVEIKFVRKDSK